MMNKKAASFMQIFLLVFSIFAMANFANIALANSPLDIFGMGGSDEHKVMTCIRTLDGSVCQQLDEDLCNAICAESCIESDRESVPECKAGVCIDDEEGICAGGSTRENCESKGGRFVEGSIQSVAECQMYCCVLGNEAQFVTEKRCEILSDGLGIEMNFDTNFYTADLCALFVKEDTRGACTWPVGEEGKSGCSFISLSDCVQTVGSEAGFHEDKLCSNPELDTICEKKNHTACVDGLDGVYWFDTCGNRENIFSSLGDGGWNQGEVLALGDSCSMGPPGDRLKNQGKCGNCDRLLGSTCAEELDGQELDDDPDSGVVCKDLGCDNNGQRRENGETWCEYSGNFGLSMDIPFLGAISSFANLPIGNDGMRAISPPGSEHFRKTCIDGEIIAEACGPYRNGICIQSEEPIINGTGTFSVASCIPNRWAECLNYNKNTDDVFSELTNSISQLASMPIIGPAIGKALTLPSEIEQVKVMKMMLVCETDPDCFVKTVSVDEDFRFPMCMPKYPPGFYKKEMDESDAGICAFASHMCSTVWVKESTAFTFGATAHWECKANCDCIEGDEPGNAEPSSKFVNEMHALCVSLGDCGSKANYVGNMGGLFSGYELQKAEYEGLPKTPDEDRKKEQVNAMPVMPVMDSSAPPGKYIDAAAYTQGDGGSSSSDLFGFGGDGGGGGSGGGGGGDGDGGGMTGPEPPGYEPAGTMGPSLAVGGTVGALGLGVYGAAQVGIIPTLTTTTGSITVFGNTLGLSATTAGHTAVGSSGGAIGGETLGASLGSETVIGPAAVALQGAAIGASIAVAVVGILVGVSGIGAGVGTAGTVGYMAGSAIGGAAIGTSIAISSASAAVTAGTATAGQAALAGWAASHATFAAWVGPVGIAIVVIIIADIIAQWIAGVGEIRTAEMYFECKPWTAPAMPGCDICGENGLPCNQYNCETLGHMCEFIHQNEGVEEEDVPLCVAIAFNDMSGPTVNSVLEDALSEGFEYSEVTGLDGTGTRFEVVSVDADGGCVNQFESIEFGFVLNEPGSCRYSFDPDVPFEEMYILGSGVLKRIHKHSIGNLWEIIESGSEDVEDVEVYIRCKDYQLDEDRGGTVSSDIILSFCVDPMDLTAPIVVGTNIPQGHTAGYHEDEVTLVVTFDEFVESASIDIEDKELGGMDYEMRCSKNVCVVDITLDFGSNNFYIRAKDMSGNEMSGSYVLSVGRSEDPLEIVSVEHDGEDLEGQTIVRGNYLNAIEVVVETSGGFDGTADCAYSLPRYGESFFQETGGGETSTHRQIFTSLIDGDYRMGISCTDTSGNNALTTVNFTVEADIISPSISRVYDDSGTLVVITGEYAECAYTNNRCNFEFSDGELMGGIELIHRTSFDPDKTYYVKCKDSLGNEPATCGLIVTGGLF